MGLPAQTAFEARIAGIESILDQHFRGPQADEARERSNREIEAFNTRSKALNAEVAQARVRMEKALVPALEAYAGLQKVDAGLKASIPDGGDREGNAKYAARIQARNVMADKVKALNALGQRGADEYNALAARIHAELEQERRRVVADREAVDILAARSDKFAKSGEDIAFFVGVNRLLAEIRTALKGGAGSAVASALTRVRAIRRELGVWAMAEQARNPKGLVVVEALVGDEPCWLIVDSGASETILSQELVDATGSGAAQSEAISLVVVGGVRLQGRRFTIPRICAAGQTLSEVSASAIRPTNVGLDGLLGQSFLKAFVYTIDERTPAKLLLTRR